MRIIPGFCLLNKDFYKRFLIVFSPINKCEKITGDIVIFQRIGKIYFCHRKLNNSRYMRIIRICSTTDEYFFLNVNIINRKTKYNFY